MPHSWQSGSSAGAINAGRVGKGREGWAEEQRCANVTVPVRSVVHRYTAKCRAFPRRVQGPTLAVKCTGKSERCAPLRCSPRTFWLLLVNALPLREQARGFPEFPDTSHGFSRLTRIPMTIDVPLLSHRADMDVSTDAFHSRIPLPHDHRPPPCRKPVPQPPASHSSPRLRPPPGLTRPAPSPAASTAGYCNHHSATCYSCNLTNNCRPTQPPSPAAAIACVQFSGCHSLSGHSCVHAPVRRRLALALRALRTAGPAAAPSTRPGGSGVGRWACRVSTGW